MTNETGCVIVAVMMKYLLAAVLAVLVSGCITMTADANSNPEGSGRSEEDAARNRRVGGDRFVLPFETLDRGSNSGYLEADCVAVRSAVQFETLWRQVYRTRSPAPPMPELSFEDGIVLAAFMGRKPTGGYSVTVETVRLGEKEIVVELRRRSPGPDEIVTQALTAPYHLVWLELGEPDTPVRFSDCSVDDPGR